MHQAVVTADVYEDEDYCPHNRSTIYDHEMNDGELISRINDVIIEVEAVQDETTATLLAILTFRRDFCQLACHLEKYTYHTIGISGTAIREKQQPQQAPNPDSTFHNLDLPSADFILTIATQMLASLTLLLKQEEVSYMGDKVETFFRPMLARLMLTNPVRAVSIPSVSAAIMTLIDLCRDLLDTYQMTTKWKEKAEKNEGNVVSFEFLFTSSLHLCHSPVTGKGKHIIARSFYVTALHTLAVTLDLSLQVSMQDRGIPSYVATHEHCVSWLKLTPMMIAWDMLKLTCTSHNRILHRLTNSILPSLSILVAEGYMLDEQMRRDVVNVNPDKTGQWNVAYASSIFTFHGDLYLQALLELGIIDVIEHDYVFWQWDHMLTSHMACLDRIRALRLQIDIKTYEDWKAIYDKKQTQITAMRQQQQLALTNGTNSGGDKKEKKEKKKKRNQREIDTAVPVAPTTAVTTTTVPSAEQLQQLDEELVMIQSIAPPTPQVIPPSTEDYLSRGKAMLCRGIFRVALALKQLGLLTDPRNEYCSKESIFNRRFSVFADSISPTPLKFSDFLIAINRDALNKPQFTEQARLAQEQEATFLIDLKGILQQAMTYYQQARKHFDEARKHTVVNTAVVPTAGHDSMLQGIDIAGLSTSTADQAMLLVKVVVASNIATTKLLQYVSEGSQSLVTPANIKLRLKVNFNYHRQFPVYEIVAEEIAVAAPTAAAPVVTGTVAGEVVAVTESKERS